MTLENPLDCKEIQLVHPKTDQSWVFIERTDVEAETPILWPPEAKSWLIRNDSDSGKDWGQEEKGRTEDEMVGWHHQLNGYGFGWTLAVGDGQGGLACRGSWGCKEWDMTEWLNWTELIWNWTDLTLSTTAPEKFLDIFLLLSLNKKKVLYYSFNFHFITYYLSKTTLFLKQISYIYIYIYIYIYMYMYI